MYVGSASSTSANPARIGASEVERLESHAGYDILGTPPEPQVDSDVDLARALFDTPMAARKQYSESGQVLNSGIKSLRDQMPAAKHRNVLAAMPGFAI